MNEEQKNKTFGEQFSENPGGVIAGIVAITGVVCAGAYGVYRGGKFLVRAIRNQRRVDKEEAYIVDADKHLAMIKGLDNLGTRIDNIDAALSDDSEPEAAKD